MNVGLISPAPGDGSSFYRGFGPFARLSRKYSIRLISGEYWGWEHLVQCDVLFIQRPFLPAHRKVVELAKSLNVPVWIDYDDDLFNLPMSNPAFQTFMIEQCHKDMTAVIEMADLITVPTQGLLESGHLDKNKTTVIPNALDDYLWNLKYARSSLAGAISWRGTATHHEDMEPYITPLAEIANANPLWNVHFLGTPHWSALNIYNARWHRFDDNLMGYMQRLQKIAPAIHVVMLSDNKFNASKSPIAWLESTLAGAVVVAPDQPAWTAPGIVNYRPDKFAEAVNDLMNNEGQRQRQWMASRQYILDNLLLSNVNERRYALLQTLANIK